ncbi:MAG: rhodanese-like domain-containing protein [Marinibacterium sp.]
MFSLRQMFAPGMSVTDAIEGAKNGSVTIIDVRDHNELASTGKAAGALHIPMSRLRDMIDPRHPDFHPGLKDAKRIALYCASGARSQMAAMALRQMGYEDVNNIGGFAHWVQAGGPVERV